MARERADQNGASSKAESQADANLSVAVVHQLVKLMSSGDIEEITVEEGDGLKLTLRKPAPVAISVSEDEYDLYLGGDGTQPVDAQEEKRREVRSPLVGVFRASMKPGTKPLVNLGSTVREGQIIAAVEALAVLNEVEAAEAGTIREILVEDGQAVEYGQPLFVLE
jgi:acetyl-CoA carboxylase biotin carboxyl carrier protein